MTAESAPKSSSARQHAQERARGDRFAFGENWARFAGSMHDHRIVEAEKSLQDLLGRPNLDNVRFLDAGCGSGLFSLAAHRLGASAYSFDFDPLSVACTMEMKRRYVPEASNWRIEEGSVLDLHYLRKLGEFDVVYSWGVLHHTGAMWQGMDNLISRVAFGGQLFLAIYNDQGSASARWVFLKRLYNKYRLLRPVLLAYTLLRMRAMPFLRDLLRGRPLASWNSYSKSRGMSAWHDLVDWIGGYPFEVAKPEQVVDFCIARGLTLERMTTCGGGSGCNQFVFRSAPSTAPKIAC